MIQKWEYLEKHCNGNVIGDINNMATAGWEFVAANFSISPYRLYFKRPIQPK